MSSPHHDVVRSLLRPSENLECILDVELAAENNRTTQVVPSVPPDQTHTPFPRHLIAVVTHRNYPQGTQLGW